MPSLQKLGLSEKILAKPNIYKATPIKEGVSILLQNRKEEYTELQKKTTSVVNNFHANNAKAALKREETQFIITSEITRFLKIHKKQTQKVQESIDVMVPLINAPSKMEDEWSQVKKSLKRGVKFRLITQEPGEETPRTPWQNFEAIPSLS
jgi:sugar-specific transcriptional regulator TrmB